MRRFPGRQRRLDRFFADPPKRPNAQQNYTTFTPDQQKTGQKENVAEPTRFRCFFADSFGCLGFLPLGPRPITSLSAAAHQRLLEEVFSGVELNRSPSFPRPIRLPSILQQVHPEKLASPLPGFQQIPGCFSPVG